MRFPRTIMILSFPLIPLAIRLKWVTLVRWLTPSTQHDPAPLLSSRARFGPPRSVPGGAHVSSLRGRFVLEDAPPSTIFPRAPGPSATAEKQAAQAWRRRSHGPGRFVVLGSGMTSESVARVWVRGTHRLAPTPALNRSGRNGGWRAVEPPPGPRQMSAVTMDREGRVVCAGGFDHRATVSTSSVVRSSLLTPEHAAAATAATADTEEPDQGDHWPPGSDPGAGSTWRPMPSLAVPRSCAGAAMDGTGGLWVAGGGASMYASAECFKSVEHLADGADGWAAGPPLGTPRCAFAIGMAHPSNQMFAAGG